MCAGERERTNLGLDIIKGIKDEASVLERGGSSGSKGLDFKSLDKSVDVVTSLHSAQKLNRMRGIDQRALGLALYDGGEEIGLDVCGLVDARGYAVGDEV
jgi:hypothetical protein